jgi:hypothetical protein
MWTICMVTATAIVICPRNFNLREIGVNANNTCSQIYDDIRVATSEADVLSL